MLTIHGLDIGKAFGGSPEITQHDVAAMMRGMAPQHAALLRCKYCLEPPHDIWAYWFQSLMDLGWAAEFGQVEAISQITLAEHLDDNRCEMCSGQGGVTIADKWSPCPVCSGAGYFYLSDSDIAERVGLSELTPTWRARINECRKRLQQWEHTAIQQMVDANRVNP